MARTEHDPAARRRGELTFGRGSLRLSWSIDARRRLNTRRPDGPRTKADPHDPRGSRYAYLVRWHNHLGEPEPVTRGSGSRRSRLPFRAELAGDLGQDVARCAIRDCARFVRSNEGHNDDSQTEGDRIRATHDATAKFRRASRSADSDGFNAASGAQARSGGASRQARLKHQRPDRIHAAQVSNRDAPRRSLIGENLVR